MSTTPSVLTPNLNKLASQGIIMDSVYAQPSCTPSRTSLMTGYYPFHTELQKAISPAEALYLPSKYKLLPQYLKELGYATHLVGKWHLGFCQESFIPTRRGFDSFYGILTGSNHHYYHTKADVVPDSLMTNLSLHLWGDTLLKTAVNFRTESLVQGTDFWFNESIWMDDLGTYSTHAYTTRAVDIIKRHDHDTPLFLYLPYQAPHTPVEVPDQYSRKFKHIRLKVRRDYLGMVSAIDESVGNITAALYAKGLMDNLILIFTSDNGGHPYMGGNNWPLRGGKSSIWEGGTRVPTFVYSQTHLQRKTTRINQIMHSVDWLPTLLEAAGRKPVYGIDGQFCGIKQLIVGRPGMHNDWYPPPGTDRVSMKVYKGGKYDRAVCKDPYMLFNIKEDPSETVDLSKQLPYLTEALQVPISAPQCDQKDSFAAVTDPWILILSSMGGTGALAGADLIMTSVWGWGWGSKAMAWVRE
ncbi:hypothetical protein Btru_059286 [Bulinus truncatus]|nr:hypothetical protein Btru_059286 [Bulinus truncatus]